MDSRQFDRLTRSFSATASRRDALRGLAAGLLAVVGFNATQNESDARRRRNHHNNRNRCGEQYRGCNEDRDCCFGLFCRELDRTSAEARSEGVCAYRHGCGQRNDYCQKNKDCCRDFRCRGKRCTRR